MKNNLTRPAIINLLACELLLLVSLALAFVLGPYAFFIPDIYLGGGHDAIQLHGISAIVVVFMFTYTASFLVSSFVNHRLEPNDPRKVWNHVSITTIANTAAVVYLFLFSDRTFIVRFYGLTFLIYPLLFLASRLIIDSVGRGSATASLKRLFVSLPRALKSIWPVCAVISVAMFGALFATFYVDKDIRNTINVLRASNSISEDTNWALEPVCPDLIYDRPIDLEFQHGSDTRYFVLERAGRIKLTDGACNSEVVLDFKSRVTSTEIENGALAIAVHPGNRDDAAKTNDSIFVYYTGQSANKNVVRLSRFDISADFRERAATEQVLIEQVRNDSGFHNGGTLLFDNRGFLFWSVGELTNQDAHQRIDAAFAGGILRIDVDMLGGDISSPIRNRVDDAKTQGYFIPNDNPFFGVPDALEEFWALGLRNPFRAWLDEHTNEIWVGDVGTDTYEEITIVKSGDNGQFPIFEGPLQQRDELDEYIGLPRPPAYYYRQTSVLRAVIGGGIYRGSKHASLMDEYVFADNQAGFVYSWDRESDTDPRVLVQSRFAGQNGITSLAFPSDGEIYVTALGSGKQPSGLIARLRPLEDGDVTPARSQPNVVVSNYDRNCVRCHGVYGRGAGARALVDDAPDFTDSEWQESVSDEHIAEVIVGGGGAVGLSEKMPAWQDSFTDTELEKIIDRIRSFDNASD